MTTLAIIAFILLTLAVFAPWPAYAADAPDVYTDDAGCRWIKKTAKVVKAAARPASAPVKPKKRTFAKTAAPAGYDAIGCDEGGPLSPTAALPLEPAAPFTPVPEEPTFQELAMWVPENMYAVPGVSVETDQPCDCFGAAPPVLIPGGGGGGIIVLPDRPVSPIPEPGEWALLLAGLALMTKKLRR